MRAAKRDSEQAEYNSRGGSGRSKYGGGGGGGSRGGYGNRYVRVAMGAGATGARTRERI